MRCFSFSQTFRRSFTSLSVSSSFSKESRSTPSQSLLSALLSKTEIHSTCLLTRLSISRLLVANLADLRAYMSCSLVMRVSFSVKLLSRAYRKMYFIIIIAIYLKSISYLSHSTCLNHHWISFFVVYLSYLSPSLTCIAMSPD